MANTLTFLDLPVDILWLIFPYLDARDYLSLTSTCQALHKSDFVHDAHFWSALVRNTFRVPNQPVVQNDGERWQKLYRRLLTQSRIYTWGSSSEGCLGHSSEPPIMGVTPLGVPPRARRSRLMAASWPEPMDNTQGLGVVSDVQCGGWSTSLLTAKGAVHTVGTLDADHWARRPPSRRQVPALSPTPLKYPPSYVPPHQRYDPSTAIKQFSSGRAHVLGLSDSGRIWSWQNVELAALHVRFLHHETRENQESGPGTVRKVVAGWNKSAAFIEGPGIVVWDPLQREYDDAGVEDAALVMETAVVPNTGYRRPRNKAQRANENDDRLAETVGEVLNFVLLEHVVLFNTSIGKLFAAQIFWDDGQPRIAEPIELALSAESENADAAFTTDVQGSFRRFAVFTRAGEVLTGHQDRITDLMQGVPSEQPLFKRIAALQHKDVISVAFGDYHFHALHSSGHITSYGTEPQASGALGLGGHGDPEGRLRGIRYQSVNRDGLLVPHAYAEGRRVWFEHEKRDWIRFLTAGGAEPEEAAERIRMALGSPDVRCQGEVSEWVEQQGRDWESKFGVRSHEDDGLPAYFALSVTAAGWHSGALVLVNEDLAAKARAACEVRDPAAPLDPPPTPPDEQDDVPATPPPGGAGPDSSLLTRVIHTALDYGRWFLGVGPYSAPPLPSSRPKRSTTGHADGTPVRTEQIHVPRNYGDSPREGYKYVWSQDHFPRLRLSSGVEMPGSVMLDEWRFDRPVFDLEAGP